MFHEYNWFTRNLYNKEIKGLGLDKFARGGEKKICGRNIDRFGINV